MAPRRPARTSAGESAPTAARPRMSLGGWFACITTGLVIAASLTAYVGYHSLSADISTAHVDSDDWKNRPSDVEGIHNILLMGSDVRTGENAEYGEVDGVRPDVMIIASIDADKNAVTLVNLPRDLMVDIPACEPAGDGFPGTPGVFDQLNHAMMYGGVNCQWKTIEELTGVHLKNFAMVDFVGFKEIVNVVGGVPMCIPKAVDDPKAKLRLQPGEQVLNGEQALGLARSRDSTEFGSDLGRIENQQRMLGSIVRKMTSGDTLSSPTTVYSFLNAVTDALTTDDELTVDKMADLAIAMREVDLERISFVTPPVVEYQPDDTKVVLKAGTAGRLFDAVSAGEVLPGDAESGKDGGEDRGGVEAEPADVSVRVLNNTATAGLGARTAENLRGLGFTVTGTGNADAHDPSATTVYHGPDRKAHAEALAARLSAATTQESPAMEGGVELVIAGDWAGVDGSDSDTAGEEQPASVPESESEGSVAEDMGGTTAAADEKADACA